MPESSIGQGEVADPTEQQDDNEKGHTIQSEEQAGREQLRPSSVWIEKAHTTNRWGGFASALSQQRRDNLSQDPCPGFSHSIPGAYLDGFLQNAQIPIFDSDGQGESFLYSYLPAFIFNSGEFLRKKGKPTHVSCYQLRTTAVLSLINSSWIADSTH